MITKKKPTKKHCPKCEKEMTIAQNFYSADSLFFPDGKLNICKSCCTDIMDKYGFDGFKSVLRMINKPLLQSVYNGGKTSYVEYIRQINSLPQYKKMTFEDSDMFIETKLNNTENSIGISKNKLIEMSEEELEEAQEFWGSGFQPEDYYWLTSEFTDFLNKYEVDSKGMELLIQEICLTQLDIRKRRALGEKVDAQLKTLQDLLGSSNLKPVQETGANAVEQESFGTLIKKFEREKPIPEPDPQWKDVDGIGKYIRTFFLGHMARAIGAENKFQDEYNDELEKYTVKQEDNGDENE